MGSIASPDYGFLRSWEGKSVELLLGPIGRNTSLLGMVEETKSSIVIVTPALTKAISSYNTNLASYNQLGFHLSFLPFSGAGAPPSLVAIPSHCQLQLWGVLEGKEDACSSQHEYLIFFFHFQNVQLLSFIDPDSALSGGSSFSY